MTIETTVNKQVILASSNGPIKRVVVADLGEVILVCRQTEYLSALEQGRDPVSVGFKKADILKT